ncbi:MAG: PDZ domain-containing protein [Aureispira sp.]|nr:PDZ domain-containing protein [Aureispira sp.]
MRILLKQSKRLVMGLSLMLGGTLAIPLQAQKAPDVETKKGKITIITKTIDSEGNKNVERIEKSFDTDAELESLENELDGRFDLSNGNEGMKIIKKVIITDEEVDDVRIDVQVDVDQEKKPFLGVQFKSDGEGVIVTDVIENSAAQKAGLQKNDRITQIGGAEIKAIPDLLKAINQFKVGDEISINYQRGETTQSAQATLGERPTPKWEQKWSFDTDKHIEHRHYFNGRSNYGSCKSENPCTQLSKMQGQAFLGVYINSSKNGGAEVTSIIESTGAEAANLKEADRIIKINRKKIASYHELVQEIKKHQPGDKVKVTYVRDGETKKVQATLSSLADAKPEKVKQLETLCEKENPEVKEPINDEPTVEPVQKEDKEDAAGQRVSDLEGVSLDLFPNPSQGIVNIKFEGQNAPLTISVLNVDGKEVYNEEVSDFGGTYNKQVDLSGNASGLYIINISQGEKTMSKQLVLE